MSSNRNTILEYLRDTLLPGITTGGGYNFTVALVDRGVKNLNEMSDDQFPYLAVGSADEQRKNITNNGFQSALNVKIWGAVKSNTGSNSGEVQEQLDKLIEDVTKRLHVDVTQGSRVNKTEIQLITTDEGDNWPHAYFRMEVEFLYTGTLAAP